MNVTNLIPKSRGTINNCLFVLANFVGLSKVRLIKYPKIRVGGINIIVIP